MRAGLPHFMKGNVGSVSPQLMVYLEGIESFSVTFGGGCVVCALALSRTSWFMVVLKSWVMDSSVTLSPEKKMGTYSKFRF